VGSADSCPQDLEELQRYFSSAPGQIQAVPGSGLEVPIWLLGSSLFSAQLAAIKGLPFAFASHFAPALLEQALEVYRSRFRPSAVLERPYAMLGVNLFAADTDEEARLLFSSVQQQFIALRFGKPGPLPPPMPDLESGVPSLYLAAAEQALAFSAVGSAETVERKLQGILNATAADELILTGQIFDHQARLRSFEIGAQVRQRLSQACPHSAAS
jgi:luciferase family oxidoreductase group 1